MLLLVIENKSFNAADVVPVKYEIYGLDSGLEASEITGDTTNPDQTVYTFKLASDENAKEGSFRRPCLLQA